NPPIAATTNAHPGRSPSETQAITHVHAATNRQAIYLPQLGSCGEQTRDDRAEAGELRVTAILNETRSSRYRSERRGGWRQIGAETAGCASSERSAVASKSACARINGAHATARMRYRGRSRDGAPSESTAWRKARAGGRSPDLRRRSYRTRARARGSQ